MEFTFAVSSASFSEDQSLTAEPIAEHRFQGEDLYSGVYNIHICSGIGDQC